MSLDLTNPNKTKHPKKFDTKTLAPKVDKQKLTSQNSLFVYFS